MSLTGPWLFRRNVRRAISVALAIPLGLLAFAGQALCASGGKPRPAEGGPAVIVVRLPEPASWQDMAFLAAVPAATVRNGGRPAVIALEESGVLSREIADYLRRYRPRALYALDASPRQLPADPTRWTTLTADSAESAARTLALTFWKSTTTAVACREDDYGSALVASALAARLRAPLLFVTRETVPTATAEGLRKLGVKKVLLVGRAAKAAAKLKTSGLSVAELADARAVLAWLRNQKLPVTYYAVTNPRDRKETVIRKLSLTAALLAAGRQGAVVPLAYKTLWQVPLAGADCKDRPPKGTPESRKPPRRGRTSLDGHAVDFVVTSGKSDKDYFQANIDLNGNGDFSDSGEGPFRTGDAVTLGGERCSLTLGEKNGAGKADLRLTRPCADRIVADLKACYAAAGAAPEHLCIVGLPDTIPQAVVPDGPGSNRALCSDFPLGNTDGDLFAEAAVGRVIAESASFATLYASRVLTYDRLLDGSWSRTAAQARWENTYAPLFENVGFTMAPHHDVDTLKWIESPTATSKGRRARFIGKDSPLTRAAVLAHQAHSWWHDLGQTYDWQSEVLLAPTMVESGGCLTTALDRQPDFRSVVSRLLRNGAVGFVGNALPAIACDEQERLVFWNAALAGQTIGQAHREALNSVVALVLETGQLTGGPNRLQLYLRGLFGDPALRLHVPSRPRSAPARVAVKDNVVSVHAPAAWWPVKIRVPEDWKKWRDKDLYVVRGAGTWPNRHWIGAGYDQEETYVDAALRTARKVKAVEQVQAPPAPLGWTGKYVIDENADGTRTVRWRVRMVDFDQIKGTILKKVDRLDYRVTFE